MIEINLYYIIPAVKSKYLNMAVTKLKTDCPCESLDCKRHENCGECRKYHDRKKTLPFCKRDAKNNPD